MRSVVGGDGAHGARRLWLHHGGAVAGGAQRRLHFVIAVIRAPCPGRPARSGGGVTSQDTGRPCLRRNPPWRRRCVWKCARCGTARRVSSASSRSQRRHHHIFRGGGMPRSPNGRSWRLVHIAAGAQVQILAVLDDGQVVRARELHGAAHHAGVHHGRPSSEMATAPLPSCRQWPRVFPGAALGNGADGKDVDDALGGRAPQCNW